MANKLTALRVDIREGVPDYLIVKQRLAAAIAAGFWVQDEPLPSVDVIAEFSGVTADSARHALDILTREGQIKQNPNGEFVITPKIDQPLGRLTNLSVMLKHRGFVADSRWLGKRLATPNDEEMANLDIPSTSRVAKLERLRLAGDTVMGLEVSSLPEDIVPEPERIEGSLYAYLAAREIAVASAKQHIEALVTGERLAKITGFALGLPLLHLIRVSYDQRSRPIELTHSYFRSDYYRFVVDLKG
ncbi:GntR family transcriptional regulator [Andreprevotia chitinilytica]|uniref:GntR family transcriptional regulator n=1 Tax=Andreprevotia chitinilytica TaxID=396808 RepID=UPI000556FD04|nr:GntR family transcriptional regulator [Andreprevotia chitinilytica]